MRTVFDHTIYAYDTGIISVVDFLAIVHNSTTSTYKENDPHVMCKFSEFVNYAFLWGGDDHDPRYKFFFDDSHWNDLDEYLENL